MSLRRATLVASTALVTALLAPLGGTTAQAATTSLQAAYTCQLTFFLLPDADPFPMGVEAEVKAVRDGSTVNLEMSMGQPVLPLEEPLDDVHLATSLQFTADGRPHTLTGGGTVSLRPATPVELPVLKAAVTSDDTQLTLVPGALTVTVKAGVFDVPINCTLDEPVSVTVPVSDPYASSPTPPAPSAPPETSPTPDPTPETTPKPAVKRSPVLKVSLTKKSQRVRKAPAKVKVTLERAARSSAQPRGKVVVKVGKRIVTRVSVKGSKKFRVSLPRKLKVGRHTVKVVFTPKKGTAYKKSTRSVKVRVKR